MKNIAHLLNVIALALLIVSCGGSKKKPVFYGYDDLENNDTTLENSLSDTDVQFGHNYDDIVSVSFKEKAGVKYVPVTVNGFGFEMIFDTGCSGTLISIAEAQYLYSKGLLDETDFLGTTPSQIADGSIVENMVINLREVIIDGKIRCQNVRASVSNNNNAPLLLGNEILDRAASYSVDNDNGLIHFKLK